MEISKYLRIANTTGIDANARIEVNAMGDISTVDTSKIGRLGERIVRNDTDSRHYEQVRQNFLDSLKSLYGVDDQAKLPKMVLDAFKDGEVVCGRPLTKRRIAAVLDAVRRNLDYTSLHALEHGVAEHVRTFGNKMDLGGGVDLDNDESFFVDSEDENQLQKKPENKFLEAFEVIDHEEDRVGPSLMERIRANATVDMTEAHNRFAANISGKFVGPAADNLMIRFDKFLRIYNYCMACAGSKPNYATDWLRKMYHALTTPRQGNNAVANQNVIRIGINAMHAPTFLDETELKEEYDVNPDTYTLDEAIKILQKWNVPEQDVPDVGCDSFDMETTKAVFGMDVALSFNDPKLTKKVMEGAKKFEAKLRAEAKDRLSDLRQEDSKLRIDRYVENGMRFFKGESFNVKLGELWSEEHLRLENPEDDKAFESEMRGIRMHL